MRTLPVLAAAGALAVAAVPAHAATKSVRIGDNFFSPKSLTVSKGTTVKWVWKGRAPHDVVGSGPVRFRSGTAKTSGTYSRRFTRTGRYRVVCSLHPEMRMTLRVR